jgi:Type II restriction endonuclease, TdeIII
MDKEIIASIKTILVSSLEKTLHRHAIEEPYDPLKFRLSRPFHARLVPDEVWRVSKFERSLVTSIGQGVFEKVVILIAQGSGYVTKQGNRETGEIWTGQLDVIRNILIDLRANRGKPHWDKEVQRVINAAGLGEKIQHTIISDIYIQNPQGQKYFYSLKGIKLNLDQIEKVKSDLLTIKALDISNKPFLALPYNPYITRDAYDWTQAMRIFDMRQDPCVLIGEEFWDNIGGSGTYNNLLDVFEEAGQEFLPQIQAYLKGI